MKTTSGSWPKELIGRICTIEKGKKPADTGPHSEERIVPYINIKAFETGTPEEFAKPGNYPICKETEVLIVWDGARSGLVGRGVSGYIGSTLARVTSHKLNNEFLFYFLKSQYQQINSRTRGVGIPHVDPNILLNVQVPVPPPDAQDSIVQEIRKRITYLDAVEEALHRVQEKLKKYRAAVLKAACEGRLVPTEAELAKKEGRPYETGAQLLSRILTARRKNWQGRGQYKEPYGTQTMEPSAFPEGWTLATIEQITSLIGTGATPYRGKKSFWENGTIPWVTSGALNDNMVTSANEFITPLAIKETNAKVFPVGTLLIALYGEGKTRGMVSELGIEAATNQACAALLFDKNNGCLRQYIKIFLKKNYEDVRMLSSGGVQPNLSLSIVKQTVIPFPPLAEQSRLVAEVERRLSVVDELEALIKTNLQRAARLRQSILQQAFAGDLQPGTSAEAVR